MLFLALPLLAGLATAASTSDKSTVTTGCGRPVPTNLPPLGTASYEFHIQSSGGDRTYLLFAPSTYDINKPTSLIFSFHGHGKTAGEQEDLSQLSNPEFNQDAIVIYPQGIDNQWQGDPNAPTDISDIQFTSDMIDHLTSRYCIDSTRIYASGKSNGGGFTGLLACSSQLSSKFAAFAACSGAFYEKTATDVPCNPSRSSIPFLEFHGTNDKTISYTGGRRKDSTLPKIPDYLASWATRNGCARGQHNTTTYEYDNNVQVSSWSCGANKDVVQGYLISGMGHDWPSTEPNDDDKTGHTYLNATPLIVDFFNKHTLAPVSVAKHY